MLGKFQRDGPARDWRSSCTVAGGVLSDDMSAKQVSIWEDLMKRVLYVAYV